MQPIATDGVAWSVSLSVSHDCEPRENGWNDHEVVREVDSGGPKEPHVRWGIEPHKKW